jgi:hypothetical protein
MENAKPRNFAIGIFCPVLTRANVVCLPMHQPRWLSLLSRLKPSERNVGGLVRTAQLASLQVPEKTAQAARYWRQAVPISLLHKRQFTAASSCR